MPLMNLFAPRTTKHADDTMDEQYYMAQSRGALGSPPGGQVPKPPQTSQNIGTEPTGFGEKLKSALPMTVMGGMLGALAGPLGIPIMAALMGLKDMRERETATKKATQQDYENQIDQYKSLPGAYREGDLFAGDPRAVQGYRAAHAQLGYAPAGPAPNIMLVQDPTSGVVKPINLNAMIQGGGAIPRGASGGTAGGGLHDFDNRSGFQKLPENLDAIWDTVRQIGRSAIGKGGAQPAPAPQPKKGEPKRIRVQYTGG